MASRRLGVLAIVVLSLIGIVTAVEVFTTSFPPFKIVTQYLQTVTFSSIALGTLVIYYRNLPLSNTIYKRKARLIILRLIQFTQGLVFDIWIVIIIVLVIAWLIGFNDGIIGIWFIWCCIFWVYNLNDDLVEVRGGLKSPTSSVNSQVSSFSSTHTLQIPSGINLEESIITLEGRIKKLEKDYDALVSDKIQQSIALYTFDHQLSLRIQTLEEAFENIGKLQLSQMENVAETVHHVIARKRNRIEIIQMYFLSIINITFAWNKFLLKTTLPGPVYSSIKTKYKYEMNRWMELHQNIKEVEHSIYKVIHRFQRK